MLRTVICDLFSDNQLENEGDNLISITAVKSVSRVIQVSWILEHDWDYSGVLMIPSGVEQLTIIRGDLHGQTGRRYLGIEAYGSVKLKAFTKKNHSVRARVVLTVDGASHFDQFQYGSAGVS